MYSFRLAADIAAAGFPVKPKTLATKASRGGGPPYQLFGPRILYRWGDALKGAQARLGIHIDRLRNAMSRLRCSAAPAGQQGGHARGDSLMNSGNSRDKQPEELELFSDPTSSQPILIPPCGRGLSNSSGCELWNVNGVWTCLACGCIDPRNITEPSS